MASRSGNLRYPHLGFRISLDIIGLLVALFIIGFVDLSHRFKEVPAVLVYALSFYTSALAFIYMIHLIRHRNDRLAAETEETT